MAAFGLDMLNNGLDSSASRANVRFALAYVFYGKRANIFYGSEGYSGGDLRLLVSLRKTLRFGGIRYTPRFLQYLLPNIY